MLDCFICPGIIIVDYKVGLDIPEHSSDKYKGNLRFLQAKDILIFGLGFKIHPALSRKKVKHFP